MWPQILHNSLRVCCLMALCAPVAPSDMADVTFVSQATTDKLWILPILCERWRGPVSLAVWVPNISMPHNSVTVRQSSISKCKTFALSLYSRQEADYPVNKLRNMALSRVNTSHIFVADIDFLPSIGLRSYLRNLRDSWLQRSDVALVVPAFQRRGGRCKTVASCRRRVEPIADLVPATFDTLVNCLRSNECQVFQHDISPGSHSTTDLKRWLSQTEPRVLACFVTNRYEPYLVLSADSSPQYDERFTGYGKNKIQHVTHLRKLGFAFVVLPSHFLIHVPHPRSSDKKRWSSDYVRHKHIDHLYDAFTHELDEDLKAGTLEAFDRPPIELCSGKRHRASTAPAAHPMSTSHKS